MMMMMMIIILMMIRIRRRREKRRWNQKELERWRVEQSVMFVMIIILYQIIILIAA